MNAEAWNPGVVDGLVWWEAFVRHDGLHEIRGVKRLRSDGFMAIMRFKIAPHELRNRVACAKLARSMCDAQRMLDAASVEVAK